MLQWHKRARLGGHCQMSHLAKLGVPTPNPPGAQAARHDQEATPNAPAELGCKGLGFGA